MFVVFREKDNKAINWAPIRTEAIKIARAQNYKAYVKFVKKDELEKVEWSDGKIRKIN